MRRSSHLQRRLRSTRWSQDFANSGWRYGTNGDYLAELVDYWLHEYDWRATERAINSVSQWRTEIDGVPVHFVHERGQGPGSASHHPEPRLALDLLGLRAARHRSAERSRGVRRRPLGRFRRGGAFTARIPGSRVR